MGKFFENGAHSAPKMFLSIPPRNLLPPLEKYIMMYIKILVLVGFDLNFPLIFGINKLYQTKASFLTFQLSPCFTSFIRVIKFTLTTFFLVLQSTFLFSVYNPHFSFRSTTYIFIFRSTIHILLFGLQTTFFKSRLINRECLFLEGGNWGVVGAVSE